MLLEGIETLLVLSKEKTMSRTGSQLYISQSAVSKRIANLEKTLGKKLVEPSGRRVKLTPDALALIESIGPAFNELRGQIYDQQAMEDCSAIRLDCSETLVAGYLYQVMGEYCAAEKHLSITTNHTPRIIENVQSGLATLGFCAGNFPSNHGLITFHLGDEPYFVVSQSPLDTLPTQLITNDLTNPANAYQRGILASLQIHPVMEMDSYTAAAQLALGGVAPALVPLSIVNALNIPSDKCWEFKQITALTRPIYVCVRHTTYQSPRIKGLIKTIAGAVPTVISRPPASTSLSP